MAAVDKMQGPEALQALWAGTSARSLSAAVDGSHVALDLCSVHKDDKRPAGWFATGEHDMEALAPPAP